MRNDSFNMCQIAYCELSAADLPKGNQHGFVLRQIRFALIFGDEFENHPCFREMRRTIEESYD